MTSLRPEGRFQPEADPYGTAQQYGGPRYPGQDDGTGGAPYRQGIPVQTVPEDAWGVYEQAQEPIVDGPEYPWLPDQTLQLRLPLDLGAPAAEPAPTGGRAERRRAAQGRTSLRSGSGRRRSNGRGAGRVRPRESVLVVAARSVGELCITLGVVMLLFVAYQLWWTNVQADAAADGARNQLEQQFNAAVAPVQPGQPAPAPDKPEVFEPGKGFAIIYLPKLGLKFPIAEGTSKSGVLDNGLVGHYTGTGMPGDKAGNFALAAHRNTHGEPFRYINQLGKGDKIVVETAAGYYTYEVTGGIPETSPNNVSVIKPVPNGAGYAGPGRYITLTTCTPEFTSKFRLIVFGKMIEERPRAQGKPAAITGG
ncbi:MULTISPECIES: class E sortase [Streptomycetaceae]|uniref:class E sortase n=1 Tax=Streptomycetaceae TaxID=2062 RepID=UPI00069FA3C1|nr:class E sortase [Kitasatospora xanthocidica]